MVLHLPIDVDKPHPSKSVTLAEDLKGKDSLRLGKKNLLEGKHWQGAKFS